MAYTDLQMRAFAKIAYFDLTASYIDATENGTDTSLASLMTEEQKKIIEDFGIKESEYSTWQIVGVSDWNDDDGFYACIIETSEDEAVVAFRGSEDMTDLNNLRNDWVRADFGLLSSTCTSQQADVERMFLKYRSLLDGYSSLAMVGHSLGGNLAEYGTIVSDRYGLDDNITQCVSLDGPGFSWVFILTHLGEILNMSGVMDHYRWSLVGSLLYDLPGVSYEHVTTSDYYKVLGKHDLSYVVFEDDKSGSFLLCDDVGGCQLLASVISKGFDTPQAALCVQVVSFDILVLEGIIWTKDALVEVGGVLTEAGENIIISICEFIESTVAEIMEILTSVIAQLIAAATDVYHIAKEDVYTLVETVSEFVAKICDWSKATYNEFLTAVYSAVAKAVGLFDSLADAVFGGSSDDTVLVVDTHKLRDYASRIDTVNGRIEKLDSRLNKLYGQVGLIQLANLILADELTGYSGRLSKCGNYLLATAEDFEKVESILLEAI